MTELNLSPSKIEKFRQHREEEYKGFITKEKLIESLLGKVAWTKQATFGTAFHCVLENGAEAYKLSTGEYLIRDDEMPEPVKCTYNEIRLANEFHKNHPSMNNETWLTPTLMVDGMKVNLRMRIDGLEGNEIHEHKTTTKSLDVHFYERSLQWKIYVMSTEALAVQYNVFPYIEAEYGGKIQRKVSYHPIRFYPGGIEIEQEVYRNIRGLIHFCESNGIMDSIIAK